MRIEANTVEEFLQLVPEDKNAAVKRLYQTVSKNIPKGFEEAVGYGMMAFRFRIPFILQVTIATQNNRYRL